MVPPISGWFYPFRMVPLIEDGSTHLDWFYSFTMVLPI